MIGNSYSARGRFTKDPELRTLESGITMCSFSIAINRPKSKEAEHPEADFIDCVAWRKTAEFICNYFKKGMRIDIEGRLQTRIWEDKNGNKRKETNVIVENAGFADPKSASASTAPTSDANPPSHESPAADTDDSDDSLPF